LTSPIGGEVLKNNPHVKKLYIYKRFSFSLWKELYRDKFDTVLIFHASQRTALPFCSLLGSSHIVGTQGMNKGLDSLLTSALPSRYEHEIERRLKIVEHIGGSVHSRTLSLSLLPSEIPPSGKDRIVAIHPGSKDSFKRWPIEFFAEVGRALQEKLSATILITGTKEEYPLMQEVARLIPGSQIGRVDLSFRSFAGLLSRADLLICNDTGPFHTACALDVPALAIYASTDPSLCGPYRAKKALAISRKRACEPCLKRKCRSPFCFLQIAPCEIVEAALKLLA
jgi:ADP-heptose:LPS heptosyltransferase